LRVRKRLLLDHAWIVAVAAMVFFTNLGAPRLWDRDEPRNAGCAAEMLQRNDWVVPVFNAELRVHKPVLLYWFMMAAYETFGTTEFAARFWSALLGLGTALLTYHIGGRLFGREVGFWGAMVLATTLMFGVAARAATPDSVLIFFTTSAMAVYVFGAFPSRPTDADPATDTASGEAQAWFPRRWSVVALMYAVMGVAMLAKGPVGLVLPTASIGMFLLIMWLPRGKSRRAGEQESRRVEGQQRMVMGEKNVHPADPLLPCSPAPLLTRWVRYPLAILRPFAPLHFLRTCWKMRPITALAAALAVALPWYVWVGMRTDGAWLEGFFLVHNVGRAMQAMEGHQGPIFYYLIALSIGFFPWSVFFGPTLVELVRKVKADHRWKPGLILVACWAGVYLGLFSLARTKLPNYITPAYPAVALLTGCFLYRYRREPAWSPAVLPKLALAILVLVGVGMLIGLPLAAQRYLPGDEWLGLIALVPLVGGIAALVLQARSQPARVVSVFAATSVLFVTALLAVAPVRVDRHRTDHALLDVIRARSEEPRIASFGCMEPSWVFYAGQPITEFRRKDRAGAKDFLAGDDAFLITTKRLYEQMRPELPEDVRVVAEAREFLKEGHLVLVARDDARRVAAAHKTSAK
jgi:4-amino-4-deoxy-L-arabinose transferase-like glycosyltransferase